MQTCSVMSYEGLGEEKLVKSCLHPPPRERSWHTASLLDCQVLGSNQGAI